MKITRNGGAGMIGGVRSPMGKPMNGLIKKGSLGPRICPDTMRSDIGTSAAKIRSAQTAGKVVKPF